MDKWIVHKFGGSSVADAACFRRVADIVEASSNPREAVVLSACRGVTDALLGLVQLGGTARRRLRGRHRGAARRGTWSWRRPWSPRRRATRYCAQLERDCRDIAGMLQTVRLIRSSTYSMRDVISGYGEIWSTRLFAPFLRERGRIKGEVLWIDAREVIIVEWGSLGPAVQWAVSEANLRALVPPDFTGRLIVTGFVATTVKGKQTTLGPQRQRFLRLDLRRAAATPRRSSSGPTSTACCRPIRAWCRTPRSSISCRTTRPWNSPISAPR